LEHNSLRGTGELMDTRYGWHDLFKLVLSIQEAMVFLKVYGVHNNEYLLDSIEQSISIMTANAEQRKLLSEFAVVKNTSVFSEQLVEKIVSYMEMELHAATPVKLNTLNKNFSELTDMLGNNSLEELIVKASNHAARWLDEDYEYYGLLNKCHKSWYGVEALHYGSQGFTQYFGSMYQYLQNNIEHLSWFFNRLGDERSKAQLIAIMNHWLTFHPDIRKQGSEGGNTEYYDRDIILCTPDEVFVDCGLFTGDTVESYIRCYGEDCYKKIYGYELTPSTFRKAQENLKKYGRLDLRNKGVADKNGTMPFYDINDNATASNHFNVNGNAVAEVVALDTDITEPITFIKMDIEGAEIAALNGARKHIQNEHPKLAICLYHKLSDIIDIPRLIDSFDSSYKFYLRHYPRDFPFPTEYVLLAV
jgi:FkbM family methyltransferase